MVMHPLAGDLSQLKDAELESKVGDLTKKYFMTNNFLVRDQIAGLLDSYKEELSNRRSAALKRLMDNKSLDKLVNVS
jgi:flavorubredoxin